MRYRPLPVQAGKGLAESVEQGVGVLLSKAKDTVAAAQRAVRAELGAGWMPSCA